MSKKKRRFGPFGLAVAASYVKRRSGIPLFRWGLIAAGAVTLAPLIDALLLNADLISNGPLSSAHASFESDCSSCHSAFSDVSSKGCLDCHEPAAPDDSHPGFYTFQAHLVYRSDDLSRTGEGLGAGACIDCHVEHRGRTASPTRVANLRCGGCHGFESFASGHPPFYFQKSGAEKFAESPGLNFPHDTHVERVLPRDRGLEGDQACSYCHQPDRQGRGFEPLNFDLHCGDGCHLNNRTNPLVPLAEDGLAGRPGALTAQQLAQADPAAPCLVALNPSGFETLPKDNPRRIRQILVSHRDCWSTENLRVLRRSAGLPRGLSDLTPIAAATELPPHRVRKIYQEVIGALRGRLATLRSTADPQARGNPPALSQLLGGREVDNLLQRASDMLARPGAVTESSQLSGREGGSTPLDQLLHQALSQLAEAGGHPQPTFARPESAAQLAALVDQVAFQCRECHRLSPAGIEAVEADQRAFRRAKFSHRPHTVGANCRTCHLGIYQEEGKVSENLNLPSIDVCQSCHNPQISSDRCVDCHRYHPFQDHGSETLSATRKGKRSEGDRPEGGRR